MSRLLFHASRNCQFRFSIGEMLLSLKEKYISFFSSFQRVKYSNSLSFLRTYRTFFITFLTRYKTRKTSALPIANLVFEFNRHNYKSLRSFLIFIYHPIQYSNAKFDFGYSYIDNKIDNYKLHNNSIIKYEFRNNEKEKLD
jgi:hypothetical protein